MRTITANNKTFNEAAYPIESEPSIFEKRYFVNGYSREATRVTVSGVYADIAEAFVNGAKWSITEEVPTIVYEPVSEEEGAEIVEIEKLETVIHDKSDFSVAGDIIDHRDGRITVYMAKPTEAEKVRADVETILPIIDDETALTVVELFPAWVAGVEYEAKKRIKYNGKLYRTISAFKSAEEFPPETTPTLYTPIVIGASGYDEWKRPTGAHDAYNTGVRVEYNGKIYESTIDGNVYSPEEYPEWWIEVIE